MLSDVIEIVVKVAGRVLGSIIIEFLFELIIKGTGYYLIKIISREDPNPDSLRVLIAGCIFWMLAGITIFFAFYID